MHEFIAKNKAILCFSSLFAGALITMLLLNHSSNIALVFGTFALLTALSFFTIAATWRYFSQR
ncbi:MULTISPECIES: hypothetical protein [Corynebacterium]|uniref:Uncharacterized protein n=2 Tax=Corynebacterium TaxID=1716 RepID=A0A3G6IZW0_9CORY|nr:MULTISPECIES: hypothetical protein [Corynebacterium]AZA10228.1 hypothetical protein CPPEL_10660 [Corynebacterium pseudopelargi]QAU53348.1 hypothetical protein CPELA_10505 [Corynebacterium pelargi]GGG73096.1 hypothetical protein GCM10007338_07860 [Corynebacterium pelargi]